MKRLWGLIAITIISPEMLAILISAILYFVFPQSYSWLASQLITTDERFKFLALAPLALTGIIISKRNDLLFPDHKANQTLQEWPKYTMILDRYWACIFFCATCSGVSLAIWLLGLNLNESSYLAIFIASLIVPIITFFTFINATISLKRFLSLYNKQKH